MPSNHLILCHPVLLLPSIFPSIGVFSNELALRIKWTKNWSFIFSISPFSECSELISFRIDWFDLLTVQGTLKSLLWHHGLKASVLWWSAFLCLYINPNFPIYPSLLSPIGNHKFICTIFLDSTCEQCNMYLSLSDLTSLSIITSKSFHVTANGFTLFFFMAE